jgi:ABC-type branched-subunit amino acid transport system substrate-binding protein
MPSPRRPQRWPARLLAALVLAAACTSGGDEVARPGPTGSTAVTTARCPDGSEVPDAARADVPPSIDATSTGPEPRDGALDVGTLLPRSGDLAFLAPAAIAGVELAVADIGAAGGVLGAPVGLRHGDSGDGTPGGVEGEADRLLGAGVDVLIGPLSSSAAATVLPQVIDADAVLVSPAATSGGLDALDGAGRLFRTGPTEALQGRALADLIRSDGHRSVSIAARDDEHGRAIADGLVEGLARAGGTVASRVDHDPAADDLGTTVVDQLDTTADAIVLVGLAETALILDALAAAGEGPRERAVYGTDGNLGERLGDLVEDRTQLACMRGLLPVARPDEGFADRVRSHDPALAEVGDAALDLAAESYDAVVLAALATQAAGSDAGAAIAAAMAPVSADGTTCREPATCLDLLAGGADISYVGQTGPIVLDDAGNRADAGLTVVAFDGDGHLVRLAPHRARS